MTIALPVLTKRQDPTVEICADQCKAGCCRNVTAVVTEAEAERLRSLSRRVFIRPATDMERHGKFLGLDFDGKLLMEIRGACAFLTAQSRCSIYPDRPRACRDFPTRPSRGCLVWPLEVA